MGSRKSKLLIYGAGLGASAAVSAAAQLLAKKAAAKTYKAKTKSVVSQIDFDDMGPEIVRKDKSKSDSNGD